MPRVAFDGIAARLGPMFPYGPKRDMVASATRSAGVAEQRLRE
jgi:hypothetical protein